MDKYKNLAKYYDEMKYFGDDKISFFSSILEEYNDPQILDCACGTGYDMEVLFNLGYSVTGSDISKSMIGICRNRFEGRDVEINEVDFEHLNEFYTKKFDVILCLSNAINEANVDPVKALSSMSKVLKSNGKIVFDQGQTDFSMLNPSTSDTVFDSKSLTRRLQMEYHNDYMIVDTIDTIKETNEEVSRGLISIKIRLYNQWIKILNKCNLQGEFFGWWDKSTYDKKSSKRLIIVAQKAKIQIKEGE
jgi:ubiquinone/menaquinone biosynthesis C-methylase UbiE